MAKNMNAPMISVIMPVYNAKEYIAEAIDSILNQTYINFEFIIIDDCSTDNSYQILQSYAVKDNRIKLYRNEKNYKQAYTKNLAIEKAIGKYIAFMDADDISLPERFAKQIEFMEAHPAIDVCGTWIKEFKNNDIDDVVRISIDHIPSSEQLRILLLFAGCYIAHPTTLIRQKILKVNKYDINQEGNAEDYELWSRLVNLGYNFVNIPEVLLYYRQSAKQTSALQKEIIINKTIQIISGNYFHYFGKFIQAKYLNRFLEFRFYDRKNPLFLFNLVVFELTLRKLIKINVKHNLFKPSDFFTLFLLKQSWIREKIVFMFKGILAICLK